MYSLKFKQRSRACLKIHSWHLHASLRGIFVPNSLNAARCAAFIWHKSPTKRNAHLAESIFQTRSRTENPSNTPADLYLKSFVKKSVWFHFL
ncbi:DUF6783 domain-containing protein [Otoolea muris]|uniref:DUF6783 domain-containing protein n=1 Tax=Otoolea muris TaxID=2941515 RepID=UPI002FE6F83F